jgi:hypothetical protein
MKGVGLLKILAGRLEMVYQLAFGEIVGWEILPFAIDSRVFL